MLIEKRKISELNQAEYNPRIEMLETDEAFKKLKRSIEEFGFVEPIVINAKNNVIIGGHQRVNVLKSLGQEEVECVVMNLDLKDEKRLNLALNNNNGSWDNEKLKELFAELDLNEDEMYATGFEQCDIDNLSADFISDLLEEDFSSIGKEFDKFAITFNFEIKYKEMFDSYIKQYGKGELIECLIKVVEEKRYA